MADDPFYDLPEDVRAALRAPTPGRAEGRNARLRLRVTSGPGEAWYVIRSMDAAGFELADAVPNLRGHVEIWEGPRMIRTALVVAAPSGPGPARYEFKRATGARAAPPRDYAPEGDADGSAPPREGGP
jgi:hypothetical protein